MAVAALVVASCGGNARDGGDVEVVAANCAGTWTELADNPLIRPDPLDTILADPTWLPPAQSPDGRWQMFAHSLRGLHHYTSGDGFDWTRVGEAIFPGIRPHLYVEGDRYWLTVEHNVSLERSVIELRSTADLFRFSDPVTILEPTLDWERGFQSIVGNPFLMRRDDGTYWLYYSASSVVLPDAHYIEPRYVGVATATTITGPYQKHPDPLLSPDPSDPHRNLGAGSIKLFPHPVAGVWYALNNGITIDQDGNTGSSIRLLNSRDGVTWTEVCDAPVLRPAPGWKSQYVYAFDMRQVAGRWWIYFNARNGTFYGDEAIGLAFWAPDRAF